MVPAYSPVDMSANHLCEQCLRLPLRPHELASIISKRLDRWQTFQHEYGEFLCSFEHLESENCAFCYLLNES
jgi:hypothetical protein